jgi:hypothetical protein
MSLFKLIPAATLAFGGVANKDKIEMQIRKVTDLARIVGVQQEVNSIAKMIYLDSLEDNVITENQFIDYVKTHMRSKAGTHRSDTSKDLWGTVYRLEMNKDARSFKVLSAGPDKQVGSGDDIFAGYKL